MKGIEVYGDEKFTTGNKRANSERDDSTVNSEFNERGREMMDPPEEIFIVLDRDIVWRKKISDIFSTTPGKILFVRISSFEFHRIAIFAFRGLFAWNFWKSALRVAWIFVENYCAAVSERKGVLLDYYWTKYKIHWNDDVSRKRRWYDAGKCDIGDKRSKKGRDERSKKGVAEINGFMVYYCEVYKILLGEESFNSRPNLECQWDEIYILYMFFFSTNYG